MGQLIPAKFSKYCLELIPPAHEYELSELCDKAEQWLVKTVTTENLRDMLYTSRLYNIPTLRDVCFAHAKKNLAMVLTRPEIMAISQEHEELWADLMVAVGGTVPADEKLEELEDKVPKKEFL
jgi:hypothetical protein